MPRINLGHIILVSQRSFVRAFEYRQRKWRAFAKRRRNYGTRANIYGGHVSKLRREFGVCEFAEAECFRMYDLYAYFRWIVTEFISDSERCFVRLPTFPVLQLSFENI